PARARRSHAPAEQMNLAAMLRALARAARPWWFSRAARPWWFSRAARPRSLLLALGGCSSFPFFGKKQEVQGADAAASAPPLVAQYRLEVQAPEPLDKLLSAYLDVARFQQVPASDAISLPELDRLLATTPQQARNLLETEGYFNAEVRAE